MTWEEAISYGPDGKMWWLHRWCPTCAWPWLIRQWELTDHEYYRCSRCLRFCYVDPEGTLMANEQLLNVGFEGGFSERGAPQLLVADHWDPWFDERYIRPEWKAEQIDVGRGRVHSGRLAQKIAMTTARFDAGIWQRVNVTPGKWYRFYAHIYMWSSREDNPDESIGPALHCMTGVNSWGHWPMHYATSWGKEVGWDRFNAYTLAECIFEAWHNEVSLIVRAFAEYGVKHNDCYIDDCGLEELDLYFGEPPEEPPEEPPPGEPPIVVEVDYDVIADRTSAQTLQLFQQWLQGGTVLRIES